MRRSERAKTKPIPVRLSKVTRDRLDSAARRLSSNRAAIIRLAIAKLLPEVESGKLTIREEEA